VYYFASSAEERDTYVEAMRAVARKFRDYLLFVTVDADEYGDMTAALGLPPGSFPALSVQNPRVGQVFPLPPGTPISPKAIDGFVMSIVQGKVQPYAAQGGRSHEEL
jgi:protein disulfide-isomerase A1